MYFVTSIFFFFSFFRFHCSFVFTRQLKNALKIPPRYRVTAMILIYFPSFYYLFLISHRLLCLRRFLLTVLYLLNSRSEIGSGHIIYLRVHRYNRSLIDIDRLIGSRWLGLKIVWVGRRTNARVLDRLVRCDIASSLPALHALVLHISMHEDY